jgi:hypothetical protein
MTKQNSRNDSANPAGISRRGFLVGAAATAAGLLTGCKSEKPASAPASITQSDPGTDEKIRRPDVVKYHPEIPSKVVRARHSGVWSGYDLAPGILRLMVDTAIGTLTGLYDPKLSWGALFNADERVAIKVSTFAPTHAPLVMAVADSLQDAGIPAEQIFIFDMYTQGLEFSGYPVNEDQDGVRCYGTADRLGGKGNYTSGWTLLETAIRLSDILLSCDGVINVPGLVTHPIAGASFALKNHFGSFNIPEEFHDDRGIVQGIAGVNLLSPIRERGRLIIGDCLTPGAVPHFFYEDRIMIGDGSILMSFDPVAHDTIGLEIVSEALVASGQDPTAAMTMASRYLAKSAQAGLGTSDPDNMEMIEMELG